MNVQRERFVEITAVNTVRSALRYARTCGFPVLILGDPEQGKTTALRQMARDECGAYCEATQFCKTAKALYQMVLAAYDIRTERTFVYDLALQCFDHVDATSPLFVDEYQTLPPAILRELLHIQERCALTLVLAGNTARLARTKTTAGALDQIESRIGMRFRIDRPSPTDCTNIGIEYNVEGAEAYAALAAYGGRTSVRDLVRLLDMCVVNRDGKGSIKLADLREAVQVLRGRADALNLLSPEKAA